MHHAHDAEQVASCRYLLFLSPTLPRQAVATNVGWTTHTSASAMPCHSTPRVAIGPGHPSPEKEHCKSPAISASDRGPGNLWSRSSGHGHPILLFSRDLPCILSLPVIAQKASKGRSMALPSPAGIAKPRLHLLFNHRRASSSSVTCCSSNGRSSSEPEDRAAPSGNAVDWRSFRAQLVLKEQYAKSVNPALRASWAPAAKIADKWAHPLVEPEKGCLLIATGKLDGSHIFERTVILLLSAGVLGPVGVILNRPSLMSIKEAQSLFAEEADIAGTFSGRPLFFGGPLEECFFLLGPREGGDSDGGDVVGRTGLFEEVMPGVHYGTRESVGCAAELVKRGVAGVRDFRFFDGFCGWEREQLRDEVRSGLWRVAACSPAVLGLTGIGGGLWEEVQELVGKRRVW
ncbi:putative ACR, COG1678 family protein [Hordeum vulgare]|nr:putative ACR, COG1678 family protein [Hordeum vulgare]